jgi:dienelactone hydrolase
VYLPDGNGPNPAIIMAHGIGGIKAGGLAPFAARFCAEGFVAIVFDYRNFGGSGGQPREALSVPREREDYSTVIGWSIKQNYVDPRQIIIWGTSFAGMHVVELAVSDTRLIAAVAQSPLTDGLGERLMTPKDGTPWHDRIAARSLLSFSWRRPVRRAASVPVPLLLVVPEADSIAPVPAALEVARKAPGAELFRSTRRPLRRLRRGCRLRRCAAHGDRLPSSSRPDRTLKPDRD